LVWRCAGRVSARCSARVELTPFVGQQPHTALTIILGGLGSVGGSLLGG
jgi:hypothetical protein